ncbi:MAG TPA: hypothetical protein DCG12_23740 [Planctomycetaceae bacterium]|nr:hypothetical protein [Planctomycetaceae bacterium]
MDGLMRTFARIQPGLLLLFLCGCGYTFGPSKIPNVSTVHVPVVTTDGFRRNIDYLLTEAIQNEIKIRGAYRLTDEASADTVLQGKIVDLRKGVLSETRFDDPRGVQLRLQAEVSWIDRRSGRILKQRTFPVSHEMFQQASQVSFAPEVGQSMATAQVEAARRLAAQIVDLTEMAW